MTRSMQLSRHDLTYIAFSSSGPDFDKTAHAQADRT